MLVKAAYTGVAASLIGGKTTHVIGGLSLNSAGAVSDIVKRKLQDFWRNVCYLIIDEYSMLSKSFLKLLARNISIGVEGGPVAKEGLSFGGLSVILCGDLHRSLLSLARKLKLSTIRIIRQRTRWRCKSADGSMRSSALL